MRDEEIEVQRKLDILNERLSNLTSRVTSIEANLSRLVWIIITSIIITLMTLILKGS
ncbi:MAG: hypothetical protein IE909_05975 [Campylobacterales bacterium]|nr:hypothetical protein [Campylobacterales bacterium]